MNFEEMRDSELLARVECCIHSCEFVKMTSGVDYTAIMNDQYYTFTLTYDMSSWDHIGFLMEYSLIDIEWPVTHTHTHSTGQCTIYRDGQEDVIVEVSSRGEMKRSIVICYLKYMYDM